MQNGDKLACFLCSQAEDAKYANLCHQEDTKPNNAKRQKNINTARILNTSKNNEAVTASFIVDEYI